MGKFKVGDTVWLVGEITSKSESDSLIDFVNGKRIWFQDYCLMDADKTYSEGLADAWELARKIENKMSLVDLKYLFNSTKIADILDNFTPQEALAKIEAYEENKAIKVGDVVYADDEPDSFGVVTWVNEEWIYVMWDDGSSGRESDISDYHKTGRHIDIEHLLEQIRGNE